MLDQRQRRVATPKPPTISGEESDKIYQDWRKRQSFQRRAGERHFIVTFNSLGQIVAIEGTQRERLA